MSEQSSFDVGDLVTIKSGGPSMAVKLVRSSGNFECQWFAGKKLESGIFPGASLVPFTPEPIKPAEDKQ